MDRQVVQRKTTECLFIDRNSEYTFDLGESSEEIVHTIGVSADRDHGKTDAIVVSLVQYLLEMVFGYEFFQFGELVLPKFDRKRTIRRSLGFRICPYVIVERLVDVDCRSALIYVSKNIIQTVGVNYLAVYPFDAVVFDDFRSKQFCGTSQQRVDLFGMPQLFSRESENFFHENLVYCCLREDDFVFEALTQSAWCFSASRSMISQASGVR